jgi:hypothetical protein
VANLGPIVKSKLSAPMRRHYSNSLAVALRPNKSRKVRIGPYSVGSATGKGITNQKGPDQCRSP